jgi:hypothetical protein
VLPLRYTIAAGTLCSVAQDDGNQQWKAYRTTKELQFDRYRTYLSGAFTFERDGWLLLIKSDHVGTDIAATKAQ